MRPRSRLLSKRGLLLPTIREGAEETVKDLNEANSLHIPGHNQPVSSEDYLLSICHLAHPTFPSGDVSPNNIHTHQLDAEHQRLRLSRLSGTTARNKVIGVQQGEESQVYGRLMFSNSDPLEYLYGHQNDLSTCQSGGMRRAFVEGRFRKQDEGQARSRAHSIPYTLNPGLPRQRKSSCPEIHASISPKHNCSRLEARGEGQAESEIEEEGMNRCIKQSLISQWIADCRSAWREARVQACMLPAITEI